MVGNQNLKSNMTLNILNVQHDLERIKTIWNQLAADCNASYFLSWGWIENWISSLKAETCPQFVFIQLKGRPILAFFLGRANVVRNKIFKSKSLFLNSTGIPLYDNLCIEYNGFLDSKLGVIPLKNVLDDLPYEWDELHMPALDPNLFPCKNLKILDRSYRVVKEEEIRSFYVDLKLVRNQKGDYLSMIRGNARAQIRRSYRYFESKGPVTLKAADTLKSAAEIFDEMVALHQERWIKKGQSGAFSSDYMLNFHRRLIKNRFDSGEIQLLKIESGRGTLGCLYNFVFKKNVYFYQSGINYQYDSRYKPGNVCHVEAIKYNSELGNYKYDFLAGETRYKSQLATNEIKLVWAKIQKPWIRFWIEKNLRYVYKKFLKIAYGIESEKKQP